MKVLLMNLPCGARLTWLGRCESRTRVVELSASAGAANAQLRLELSGPTPEGEPRLIMVDEQFAAARLFRIEVETKSADSNVEGAYAFIACVEANGVATSPNILLQELAAAVMAEITRVLTLELAGHGVQAQFSRTEWVNFGSRVAPAASPEPAVIGRLH